MTTLDRRTFVALSAGALAAAPLESALAQVSCVTGALPAFTPNALTVDCASRRNYQVFRKNLDYVGLTGVVSMSFVRGKFGAYAAGNLFLFPWLKKKGLDLGLAKDWGVVFPISDTQSKSTGPIRGWKLPLDEYFCRFVIEAPIQSFIGFRIDKPVDINDARRPWFTNVKLSDGQQVAIGWNSSNLNHPWFGGSRFIPKDDNCKGATWRKLIINGLSLATAGDCAVASAPTAPSAPSTRSSFSVRRVN